jgi:hypothetical protein
MRHCLSDGCVARLVGLKDAHAVQVIEILKNQRKAAQCEQEKALAGSQTSV